MRKENLIDICRKLVILVLINNCLCGDTKVKLPQGEVLGKVEKTVFKKQEYYSFKSIPYGEAPIGKLRFQPPTPHQGWNDKLEAYDNKPTCMQFSARMRMDEPFGISGSEDCLFVSIFTPDLKANAPVVVFDYNDSFRTSFNGTDTYSPEMFMEEGVVVVTISYRLGIFGYLTTEDEVIKGNNGLRDYILALEWIQNNVKEFGGDPNKVTLMGSCGGGSIVNMLLYSEKAKGLFSSAIIQSGNAFEAQYFHENSREVAFLLGEQFDIQTNDSKVLLEAYQQIAPEDLLQNIPKVLDKTDLSKGKQITTQPFTPVIEKGYPDAILTDLPEKSKIINDVPLIIGFNSREGLDFVSHFLFEPRMMSFGIEERMLQFPIRTDFRFIKDSKLFKEARQELIDFYIESKNVDYNSLLEYSVYAGDVMASYSTNYAARKLSKDAKSPVFYYMFDFRGQLNENSQYLTKFTKYQLKPWGATIGDELCYLHVCSRIKRDYVQLNKMVSDQNERKVMKKMVRMWTNFAKTGNPTPGKDSILNDFVWSPTNKDSESLDFLHITKNLRMATDPMQERGIFWDRFIKKYADLAIDGVVPGDEEKRDEL